MTETSASLRALADKIRAFVGMNDVNLATYLDAHADAMEKLEQRVAAAITLIKAEGKRATLLPTEVVARVLIILAGDVVQEDSDA